MNPLAEAFVNAARALFAIFNLAGIGLVQGLRHVLAMKSG